MCFFFTLACEVYVLFGDALITVNTIDLYMPSFADNTFSWNYLKSCDEFVCMHQRRPTVNTGVSASCVLPVISSRWAHPLLSTGMPLLASKPNNADGRRKMKTSTKWRGFQNHSGYIWTVKEILL